MASLAKKALTQQKTPKTIDNFKPKVENAKTS